MTDDPKPRQFEMQIDIAAPRDAVFGALTDPAELSRWFAPENECDPVVGGTLRWTWGGHFDWPQRIEVLEPGARLRTRYDSPVDDGEGGKRPLFIDFLLEGEGGHTSLRLVHSGFDASAAFDDEFDGISSGWPVELRSLRLYLERHAGRDRQLAWSQVHVEDDPDGCWGRLVGPGGLACDGIDARSEGDAFEIRTPDGDAFTGEVLVARRREFTGMASSHGDGLVRFWAGSFGGVTHVWLWLACYDQDAAEVAGVQERWDAMLRRLFPVTVPAPEFAAGEGCQ